MSVIMTEKITWIAIFGIGSIFITKYLFMIMQVYNEGNTSLFLTIPSIAFIVGMLCMSLYCFIDSLFRKVDRKTIL
jgi:hypothetical protein